MKNVRGVFAGAVAAVVGTNTVLAQDDGDDIASAGNGGLATAAADGGAAGLGDINSGGNVGCAISVGDTIGPDPDVTGCDIFNDTTLAVAVDGGTSIADATGGNYNLAFVS